MGIDAATVRLGVGVLDCQRGRAPRFVAAEVISAAEHWTRTERLILIAADLRAAFAEYRPDALGIEQAFVGKGPTAGLALGEARGVVIACATVPGDRIVSIPSAKWKAALMIPGNADKQRVQDRVRFLFKLARSPDEDAADAIGVAWAAALQLRIL